MTCAAASQQGAIEICWLHYEELSGCPTFIQSVVVFDSQKKIFSQIFLKLFPRVFSMQPTTSEVKVI